MERTWRLFLSLALGSAAAIWSGLCWSELSRAEDPAPGKAPATAPEAGQKSAPPADSQNSGSEKPAAEPSKPAPEKKPEANPPSTTPPASNPATPPAEAKSDTEPSASAAGKPDDNYDLYQAFADTIDQVERNYVKPVDRRQLMEAAIHGVLSKLDPYSNYISPEELGRFKTSVESQFGGIGIQIEPDRDKIRIVSPIVGSPAYRAGLESGDQISEIEGHTTQGMTIDDAIRQLKGEAGTSVTFTVIHPGTNKKEVVTIKREIIHVDTVLGDTRKENDRWDFMLDHDKRVGYIRISAFSRDTARDLKVALDDLVAQGMKGLVIDLRFNPGGLLTSAVEISDMFVSEGRIVSTQGRNSPERTWDAVREGTYEGFPVAVLVNRFSASASEIFSACLQDHHRAVIIGERTWGKGSVQNVIDLENGRAALKLTTASYRRPSGKNIHRFPDSKESDEWGVMPDKGFELRLSDDRELTELMRYRHDRDILRAHKPPLAVATSDTEKKADSEKSPEAKPAANSKPADEKPAAEKPADEKPAAEKPAEEKPAAEKPADNPAAKPADETKPQDSAKPADGAKPKDSAKPDETSKSIEPGKEPDGAKRDAPAKPADAAKPAELAKTTKPFVDRQLQKALDYVSHEMAGAQPAASPAKREGG